ncbi:MAG: M1 family metallopeptidase [Acidobacteriota bacterium]
MLRVQFFLPGALLLASIASAQPAATGALSPPRSPRNASYSIEARLDPAARTITGSELIVWRNITAKTVDDLQFHLYWNAWRDDRSTWMREASLGGAVYRNRVEQDRGRMDVTSVILVNTGPAAQPATPAGAPDRTDITSTRRFLAPDDGNRDDQTVMAVSLPRPVAPGGSVTVEVKWTAHVPRTYARTGAIGNFFFIAQWFPKLGVLQDDGWNCHQFHATTEFFSDYGVYDVRLTVPAGWPLGATGVGQDRRDNADNTSTHRYYQEDVHDFAWTTSPDYLVRTARFEHPSLPPVEMRLLIQPEHAAQAERHFDATRNTLKHYGEWFGAYPYGHITIVDPAYQSEADGMEYPTLFTAGTRWLVVPRNLTPESVTIHEAGHQWWYAMVGSNEFEDGWMDEGLNTFSTARVEAAAYDPNYLALRYFGGFVPYLLRDIVLKRETDRNRLGLYRALPKTDAQSAPSYATFPSRAARNAISYAKTALWLNTLERQIGWPALQRVMSVYFERWRFKHPKPADFFAVVTEVTGQEMGGFFDQVYRSSDTFDYAVQGLSSTAEQGRFRTSVVVRRNGEAILPVDVLVTFADGEKVLEHWSGRDRWKAFTYDRPSRAAAAAVDPGRVLLLDTNYTNNSRTLTPRGPEAATKWSLKWMVWLQDLLLTWAFFA